MAQQVTNGCCVYLIATESGSATKIGVAADPEKRLKDLQVGNPERLVLTFEVWAEDVDQAKELERRFHEQLSDYKIRGEWFKTDEAHAAIGIDERRSFPFCEKAYGTRWAQSPVALKEAFERSEEKRFRVERDLARATDHIWRLAREIRDLTKEAQALWTNRLDERQLAALEARWADWRNR